MKQFEAFCFKQKESIFLSAARFLYLNRPLGGYYMEFGSHSATTMRLCWKHTCHLLDLHYVAFDSFEGLPEISGIDQQAMWEKGKLAIDEEHFIRLVITAGMPRSKLTTVRGFYDQTLNPELRTRFQDRKAALIWVDCDLYVSTIPVLEFIKDFLQVGTIIVFDDWNCFCADPMRGERLAWSEFIEKYPDLRFVPFVSTSEAQSFVFVGREPTNNEDK